MWRSKLEAKPISGIILFANMLSAPTAIWVLPLKPQLATFLLSFTNLMEEWLFQSPTTWIYKHTVAAKPITLLVKLDKFCFCMHIHFILCINTFPKVKAWPRWTHPCSSADSPPDAWFRFDYTDPFKVYTLLHTRKSRENQEKLPQKWLRLIAIATRNWLLWRLSPVLGFKKHFISSSWNYRQEVVKEKHCWSFGADLSESASQQRKNW